MSPKKSCQKFKETIIVITTIKLIVTEEMEMATEKEMEKNK